MADEENDDEKSIFKVDTVPPPAGDGDAYNAPTKVGPVSADAWVELIKQADAEGKKSVEADKLVADGAPLSKPPVSRPQEASSHPSPKSGPSGDAPKAAADDDEVPRLYTEEVDESNAATLLHPSAKQVLDTATRADASVFGDAPPPSTRVPAEDAAPASVLGPATGASSVLGYVVAACLALFALGLVYYAFSE